MWCEIGTWVVNHLDLLVGWILGILSTASAAVVGYFINVYRFKVTVSAELKEIRLRIATYVYSLTSALFNQDRKTLLWCLSNLSDSSESPERDKIVKHIEFQLGYSDKQLEDANTYARLNRKSVAKVLPHLQISFLKSKLDSISLLNSKKRIAIVSILTNVEVINGLISDMIYWDRLTFELSDKVNYENAVSNSRSCMESIINACFQLSKAIDSLKR
jgi:hypothetical protein